MATTELMRDKRLTLRCRRPTTAANIDGGVGLAALMGDDDEPPLAQCDPGGGQGGGLGQRYGRVVNVRWHD